MQIWSLSHRNCREISNTQTLLGDVASRRSIEVKEQQRGTTVVLVKNDKKTFVEQAVKGMPFLPTSPPP